MIILLNPISDLIATKYPSLFTKVIIDVLILLFIFLVLVTKIIRKEKWTFYPFYKWILLLLTFYVVSGFATHTGFEHLLFMNLVHFRFIYLAIAITLLNFDEKKLDRLINLILVVFILQLGIGVFQVIGGEWAKGVFYSYQDRISLSYRLLQYQSYDTALRFNPAGSAYIYSTFYLPGHYGGYLLIMLCLVIAAKIVSGKKKWNFSNKRTKPLYISLLTSSKISILILLISVTLIVLTYSRSAYFGLIALVAALIFFSKSSFQKALFYSMAFLIISLITLNTESLFYYLEKVRNPSVEVFNPIDNFFSMFPDYFFENTPRKLAYTAILPIIITQKPLFGFGVASNLYREELLYDVPELNDALYYVYGDAGIVRIFVEYGIVGVLIITALFFSVSKYAWKGYLYASNHQYKAICFAALIGIIISVVISVGTMLIISRPFGLYLWMLIGLSQKWQRESRARCNL